MRMNNNGDDFMKMTAIILAAGMGTRMNEGLASPMPKVMFEIAGKPVIDYVLENLKNAGVGTIIPVIGYMKETIERHLGDGYKYAYQLEQKGTGHAVAMAKELVKGTTRATIVSYGDMPLISSETYRKLIKIYEDETPTIVLLSANYQDPTGYGRVIRNGKGEVVGIVEHKDCSLEQLKITECNTGIYVFNNDWLWDNIDKLDCKNSQGEYYLTDLLEMASKQGKKIIATSTSEIEAMGVNTREQLKEVGEILNSK